MNNRTNEIKAIHIHTDFKFINNTERFIGSYFDNSIIIFEKDKSYSGPYQEIANFFSRGEIHQVVEFCKEADLVVLYDLDLLKSRIALLLPPSVKIAWRFFGYELYGKIKNQFLSEQTLAIAQNERKPFLETIVDFLKPFYHLMNYGKSADKLFFDAVKRIDYMLMFSEEEYELLVQFWDNLPECICLPFINIDNDLSLDREFHEDKSNTIVIGNNRSMYNNHLDLIDIIESEVNKFHYKFVLLFNYGRNSDYSKYIRKLLRDKKYYKIIEDFLPKKDFLDFYSTISAFVLNGYRQMAIGNIIIGLKNGVKIYLNRQNVLFKWLQEKGFKIYSVEDFKNDLVTDNLKLDFTIAEYNINKLKATSERYTKEDFQIILYEKIIY